MASTPSCIGMIGSGHVGGMTAVMIANKCPQTRVLVYDCDPRKIAAWNSDNMPIYEPGLKTCVENSRNTNLFFVSDLARVVREAELIFVAVNTPLKQEGIGAGEAPDVRHWESNARHIASLATTPKVVVERSTVPVRTARIMAKILRPPCAKVRHEVISNPAFFSAGTAMIDLASPELTLIGHADTPGGRAAAEALKSVYAHWIPAENIKTADVWSAELAKLTTNAFLAQRIASINSISALCEVTDADVTEVSRAIGTDSRIGPKFLKAGLGFGGACYPTHLRNLVYLCKHFELPEVAEYWHSVLAMNEWQRERFTQHIVRTLFNTVAGKKIAILGFAYKKDTADIRDTPARAVCRRLLDEGAELAIYDPRVPRTHIEAALGCGAGRHDVSAGEMPPVSPVSPAVLDARRAAASDAAASSGFAPDFPQLSIEADAYAACRGAHALVVLTEWDEFKGLEFARIYGAMKRPCFVFDGRCMLDHEQLRAIGFQVYSIGKALPLDPRAGATSADLGALKRPSIPDIRKLALPGPLDY